MTQTDIIKEWEAFMEYPENSDKKFVTTCSAQLFAAHISALATAAERESRQAAQAENEQLKARLARSGVELRKAVRDEREACAIAAVIHSQYPITTDYDEGYDAGRRNAADAIRARNHVVDANKMDCTDCDCADNDPCKRSAPGLALESGEFVPAEKITDWAAA